MLNLDKLLAPIGPDRPCGEDLAFSSEVDAINRARQADDPSLEQGAWVTDLKEADWKFVAKQCTQLIETRSKDLQLAAWLAEALSRTAGLRALGDSLLVVAGLCERWWDGLYPLPDEGGVEQRIGILAWLAARGAGWLRDIALTPPPDAVGLRDLDVARTRGEEALARIEAARQRGTPGFHTGVRNDALHCLAALDRLERCLDERLGTDGPSLRGMRGALDDVLSFVPTMANVEEPGAAEPPGSAPVPQPAPDAVRLPARGAGPQNRDEALALLRMVAAYFRRTEPHSPVAYLADKAAAWGEQPLHVWLRGVIKDDASFAQIEEILGVK
jgi:type VI secretion system protein ImpA